MAAELNKAFFLTWSVAQLVLVGCPALALDIQFSSGSARQRTPLACTHTINKNGKRAREKPKPKPNDAITIDTKDNAETRNTKRTKKMNYKPQTETERKGIG